MANLFSNSYSYSNQDKILFYRQLTVLLESGLSIMQCLKILSKDTRSSFSPICSLLMHSLQQGYTLAKAMTLQSCFFSQLAVTLVDAGEKSGQLIFVLKELANYYKQTEAIKNYVLRAALYPALLLTIAGSILIFFMLYVLPNIAETISSIQGSPSVFLQRILVIKIFLKENFWLLISSLLVLLLCLAKYKKQLVSFVFKLPFLNKFAYRLQEIRFCRLLALLLDSGFSITEAITISTATLEHKEDLSQLIYFRKKLSQGMEPSVAARCIPKLFSPLTIDFLAIGSSAGKLPEMLKEAATIQEQRLRLQLMRLKELLGPSLLLIAALLTAAVICSTLEPLFNLFTAIPEY